MLSAYILYRPKHAVTFPLLLGTYRRNRLLCRVASMVLTISLIIFIYKIYFKIKNFNL